MDAFAFLDFEAVNENISKAFVEQDDTAGFVLYDVTKKNAISNLFHFIDSFAYNKEKNLCNLTVIST